MQRPMAWRLKVPPLFDEVMAGGSQDTERTRSTTSSRSRLNTLVCGLSAVGFEDNELQNEANSLVSHDALGGFVAWQQRRLALVGCGNVSE